MKISLPVAMWPDGQYLVEYHPKLKFHAGRGHGKLTTGPVRMTWMPDSIGGKPVADRPPHIRPPYSGLCLRIGQTFWYVFASVDFGDPVRYYEMTEVTE